MSVTCIPQIDRQSRASAGFAVACRSMPEDNLLVARCLATSRERNCPGAATHIAAESVVVPRGLLVVTDVCSGDLWLSSIFY